MDHWSPRGTSSLRRCHGALVRTTCIVGFWASVLLPFAYVGVALSELSGAAVPALTAVHAVSLYAGHEYARTDGTEHPSGRTRCKPDRERVPTAGGDD